MPKKTEYVGAYELGESFPCACGESHELTDTYLAAHWDELLTHECDKCGTVHELRGGRVSRRISAKAKARE
jgi:hypothetical protein